MASHGTLLGVSTNTAVPFERIRAQGAPWWFQSYVLAEHDLTYRLAERAARAGASAIVLTVDTTALRSDVDRIEPTEWPAGPGRARLGNLTGAERERLGDRPGTAPGLDEIARLREAGGLPVVVKGILRADDARRAVDAGAAGVIVSTHGGRRMAGSVSVLAALAEVAAAVGDEAEVYVDSGVRSGRHVLAALALGARAVFVGRPVMWALADGGAAGVAAVLDGLAAELRMALRQSGAPSLSDLRGLVDGAPGAAAPRRPSDSRSGPPSRKLDRGDVSERPKVRLSKSRVG